MYTILLLTEDELTQHDVARIVTLHEGQQVSAHVLVPTETEHNRLVEALDEVALGRIREALDHSDHPSPELAEQQAMHAVNAAIDLLAAEGVAARGSVTGNDPVPAALELLRQHEIDEVIVITPPHLLSEALHRDWASRLRDNAQVPVLHVVAGTDRVVS